MIKTLRITSVLAAILAAGFIVSPAFFGVRKDEQAEKFLESTGVIEKFTRDKAERTKGKDKKSQISPLVRQARAFASYLNPAPKRVKKPLRTRPPSPDDKLKNIRRPEKGLVSAKFELIATSYYPQRPELSLALLDLPGKGLRWVKQSGQVGHLVIELIKNGLVVVRDRERTFKLVAERPPRKSLVRGAGVSSRTGSESTLPVSSKAATQRPEESVALMEKFISELGTTQKDAGSDKTDSKRSNEEKAALLGELLSKFRAMRVGAEEAEKLDDLGKELKDVQQDPNKATGSKLERSKRLEDMKRRILKKATEKAEKAEK